MAHLLCRGLACPSGPAPLSPCSLLWGAAVLCGVHQQPLVLGLLHGPASGHLWKLGRSLAGLLLPDSLPAVSHQQRSPLLSLFKSSPLWVNLWVGDLYNLNLFSFYF